MPFTLLVFDYMHWHYRYAPAALFHIWLNYMKYTEQLFSVRLHAHTLFSPWHRITDQPHKKYDLEELAASFVVNMMSRVIGFLLRTTMIISGLVTLSILTIATVPLLLIWYTAPLLVTCSILVGIMLISLSYGNTW